MKADGELRRVVVAIVGAGVSFCGVAGVILLRGRKCEAERFFSWRTDGAGGGHGRAVWGRVGGGGCVGGFIAAGQ